MPKNLTASDRSALIRLASSMEKGSGERKAILAGLEKTARGWRNLERRLSKAVGWDNPQYGEYTIFLSQPDDNGEAADGEYILVDADDIKARGDTVEAYDYQGRKESVSKRLVQKALRGRKLDSGGF